MAMNVSVCGEVDLVAAVDADQPQASYTDAMVSGRSSVVLHEELAGQLRRVLCPVACPRSSGHWQERHRDGCCPQDGANLRSADGGQPR
jgi:hypothetical protein